MSPQEAFTVFKQIKDRLTFRGDEEEDINNEGEVKEEEEKEDEGDRFVNNFLKAFNIDDC